MKDLRWIDRDPPAESLVCAMQSLLVPRGIGATYEQILTALGLGTLTFFDARQSPALDGEFGRDAGLLAAAELLGLRLRELHPISAAQRLDSSAEFEQHFIDSYVPLIRRAFEAGQAALAWHGWPPPVPARWGVLLPDAGGAAIRGVSQSGEVLPYAGPAHQVYIVEEIRSDEPSPEVDAVFGLAAAALRRQWAGAWTADSFQSTGAAALEALREWLIEAPPQPAAAALVAMRERRRALLNWIAAALGEGRLTCAAAQAWRDGLAASVERLEIASMPGIRPRDLAAVVGQVSRCDEAMLDALGAAGRPA